MTILKKNGNQNIKNYFNYTEDTPATLKYKRGIISKYKIDTPLFSWPKDKATLISIINTYLSKLKLEKINASLSQTDEEESNVLDDIISSIDKVLDNKVTNNIQNLDNDKDLDQSVSSIEKPESQNENQNTINHNTENNDLQEDAENITVNQNTIESSNNDEIDRIEYIDENEYIDIPDQIYSIEDINAKMLGNIVRILNYRYKVLKKINLLKQANAPLDVVNEEIEKVAVYNIVLAKYLPILNKQAVADTATIKRANDIFSDVCTEGYEEIPLEQNIENEIRQNKEDQDFDIVAALNYVGVSVEKDDYGLYVIKNTNNGNGIKYFIGRQEKAFALSKKSCNKFLDQFLNMPIESRKFITPGQVFITYISEAEKSLGINSRSSSELDDLFGTMNSTRNVKSYFKEMIRKYSRNASEWKNFQKLFKAEYYSNKDLKDDLSNRMHIKQQAKKMVICEMFEEFLNEGNILTPEQLNISDYRISDISRDFGLDIDLDEIKCDKTRIERIEDYSFRLINILHSSIQDVRGFVQDIIDNYTVDYLRKEKIFMLQQDDQNEFIEKKKEYEDVIEKLSYDKAKDSNQQIAYYQLQVDELTQKIGSLDYREAKEDLIKSKNNFRILLLNAKTQKELVKAEIVSRGEKYKEINKRLTIEDKLKILKEILSSVPDISFAFDKGKVTYYAKNRNDEKLTKREEKLSEVDKIIESTATRISDESHRKILEENKIRESVKKAQKEERVKSVNAYINAYGSIVGNASGVGGFGGFGSGIYNDIPQTQVIPNNSKSPISFAHSNNQSESQNLSNSNNVGINAENKKTSNGSYENEHISSKTNSSTNFNQGNSNQGNEVGNNSSNQLSSTIGTSQNPNIPLANPNIPSNIMPGYVMPGVMGTMPIMPNMNNFVNKDYQNFDYLSEGIEPCVIPFVVGYENKNFTSYGNMLEDYATYDRYKFLLTTNNNLLYSYIETKKAQIQSPEQIISDLHIRYVKNAMAKSGLSTLDSNLANFDYKSDLRRFLTKYVPQNMLDIVISDYKDLISSINFDLLKDLIEHKFLGDLENYVPEKVKENSVKCANLIATIVKSITQDIQVRRTYEEYSSKMKQTYINSLIGKIENGDIPTIKLDSEGVASRLLDYLSFSIKGQNVIIQNEDEKDSGLGTYPRSIFFKQKDNADNNLKFGKSLSFEQNEIITTKNDKLFEDLKSDVTNLFGSLYKFNGGYNKLLLKLKPYNLQSGVKFMENLIDAIREKIDIKATIIVEEDKKPIVPLVKFASKEKDKEVGNSIYEYDDDRWYIRKGFVLEKNKVQEYAMLIALGIKYVLDKDKTQLKEDFYNNNILSLNKINEYFKDFDENMKILLTSVIRNIMMTKCERFIDYIDKINKDNSLHVNKMLYINKMLMESNSFDKKNNDEKKETIESLEIGFNKMSEDLVNPHPEIYSSIEDISHYEKLYLYYALTEIFEKYSEDKRIISDKLTEFFEDKKKEFRNTLLAMIRNKDYMNGYEIEMAEYFELNTENIVTLDDKPVELDETTTEEKKKERIKIKNIDVIFKGIFDGFEKAVKNNADNSIQTEIDKLHKILEIVGTLPTINSEEKDLEIALPNNQTIVCNIKGFIQQYLFRYIVDKEHELGPFAYVVKELEAHEEFSSLVSDLEEVANILNADELGINLIAKFSSISLSNNGNIFKIGDNISTVVETINRLKTGTDIQKALNRDVFYREGVQSVKQSFEQYFSRRKVENLQ